MTISDELDMLAADTQLGLADASVTLTPTALGGWSNAGGTRANTAPDGPVTVSAIRLPGSRRKKNAGAGQNASEQEAEWSIEVADLAAQGLSLLPSTGWTITDGGDVYEAVGVRDEVGGRVVIVRGRRGG